jgi:hypothetical protein
VPICPDAPRTAWRSGAAGGSFHHTHTWRQHDYHTVAKIDLAHAGMVMKHARRPGIGVASILDRLQVRLGELLLRVTALASPSDPAELSTMPGNLPRFRGKGYSVNRTNRRSACVCLP